MTLAKAERERGFQRLLDRLFGRFYARWCVRSMAVDAARHFSAPAASTRPR